jgi:hypothetical protein
LQRYLFSAYISFYHTFSNRNVWNATLLVFRIRDVIFHVRDIIFHVRDVIFLVSFSRTYSKENFIFVTESIFYKFYYFPKFSFSAQNLFLLSIPQHVIASKSYHINTMLPNEMVLAPLLLGWNIWIHLTNCWPSTSQRLRLITLRSLIHFTIFIWYYIVKHFPSFIENHH